jgi:hypothetical protein
LCRIEESLVVMMGKSRNTEVRDPSHSMGWACEEGYHIVSLD